MDSEMTDSIKDDASETNTPNFDMFAGGIVTGVVVTVIVETGKGALSLLAKNPLFVLGSGIAAGYFTHKYRKEIILSSHKVAEKSKDFVSRQKKSFSALLTDTEEKQE
jgi:hypothetical protein